MQSVVTTSAERRVGASSRPLYHSLFERAHRATFWLLPGDCFSIEEYLPFAEHLFRRGANVHLLDYRVAGEHVRAKGLTHAVCVDGTLRLLKEIGTRYPTGPDHAHFLLGHSRGAYIAVGVLARSQFPGHALLHAPYLGPSLSARASAGVVFDIGFKFLLRRPLRLRYAAFRSRFFADDTREDFVRALYLRSVALSPGLLLDRTQFGLDVLSRRNVTIYLYTEDRAIPPDTVSGGLHRMIPASSARVRVVRLPGAHCQLIAAPGPSAQRMVERWVA